MLDYFDVRKARVIDPQSKGRLPKQSFPIRNLRARLPATPKPGKGGLFARNQRVIAKRLGSTRVARGMPVRLGLWRPPPKRTRFEQSVSLRHASLLFTMQVWLFSPVFSHFTLRHKVNISDARAVEERSRRYRCAGKTAPFVSQRPHLSLVTVPARRGGSLLTFVRFHTHLLCNLRSSVPNNQQQLTDNGARALSNLIDSAQNSVENRVELVEPPVSDL